MDWGASLMGFFVGGLIGMTGMGAGSLIAPLLILGGVPPLQAVGSDLAYAAVTKLVGAAEHIRLGTVDFRTASWMAAASLPATVLAVWAVSGFHATTGSMERPLLWLLGAGLILAGAALLAQSRFRRARPAAAASRPWVLGAGGAVLGGLVGATAAGSGTLGVALLSRPRAWMRGAWSAPSSSTRWC